MKLSEIFKNINNDNNYLVVSTNLKKEIIRAKSEFEINNKYLLDFKVITDKKATFVFLQFCNKSINSLN